MSSADQWTTSSSTEMDVDHSYRISQCFGDHPWINGFFQPPQVENSSVRPWTLAIGDPHTKCQYVTFMSFIQQVKGRWSQITCQDSPCLFFFFLSLSIYKGKDGKGATFLHSNVRWSRPGRNLWGGAFVGHRGKDIFDGSWWLMIWVWYLNMLGNLKNPIGKLWLFDS
jgi:hypothetical protein